MFYFSFVASQNELKKEKKSQINSKSPNLKASQGLKLYFLNYLL